MQKDAEDTGDAAFESAMPSVLTVWEGVRERHAGH
jgi:hypothetical protein